MEDSNISLQVRLDEQSKGILRKVDKIHRDSLINIGLALVSRTDYYKTLTGENVKKELEKVASLTLDSIDEELKKEEVKETTKPKPSTSWDSF